MQAMIFSAGLGTRFKPWTNSHPKALAPVNGKSLLQRNIEYLQQFGINVVIVNVHHFADQIVDAVKKNKGWGSDVIISDETQEVLETGGGLLKARDLFRPGERFITCNVDILTNLDINKLLSFHEKHRPLISFAVTDRKTSRYFLFDENNRLCGWRNTKTGEERIEVPNDVLIQKAYSCIVVFEYDIFRLMPFTGKFSLVDVYLKLAVMQPLTKQNIFGNKKISFLRWWQSGLYKQFFLRVKWKQYRKKGKIELPYPVVGSYSDVFIVSKESITPFCRYCGIMAAVGLFVEIAIPTALLLSSQRIVQEKDLKLQGKAIWSPEEVDAMEKTFNKSLSRLMKGFPSDQLYLHPVKLSKWNNDL